ncbi:MAG: PucR family transcriptional regulator [Propionibacteriaceae bacterium]
MISFGEVARAIGAARIRSVVVQPTREVADVALIEADRTPVAEGALVLGAALEDVEQAMAALDWADGCAASALLLKAPLVVPEVARHAEGLGIGLVEVDPAASWTELVWLLRTVLDRSVASVSERITDELFALADAAAATLTAPVTIEDTDSRVLAHSTAQEGTDPVRLRTIINRRVAPETIAHFRSLGVFGKLTRDKAVFIPARTGGIRARYVQPVHTGTELLGSIWVILDDPPGPAERDYLRTTASSAAVALLRLRIQADAGRRGGADQLRSLLQTGVLPNTMAIGSGPWQVGALSGHPGARDGLHNVALWESVLRRAGWQQPVVTDIDATAAVLLRAKGREPGSWHWWEEVVGDRVAAIAAEHHLPIRLAGGDPVSAARHLPRSWSEAAELVALATGEGAVPARLGSRWPDVTLARMMSSLSEPDRLLVGPLVALRQHDQQHRTPHVATLRALLARQGDVRATAGDLAIHPNTLRYRMGRLAEVFPADLSDPTTRLALQVQLHVLEHVPA